MTYSPARLVLFNESCPVCARQIQLGIAALRVSREMRDASGEPCVISFQCHHDCAARAVGDSPLELQRALLQALREREQPSTDEFHVEL